jgi:hypothetical protein
MQSGYKLYKQMIISRYILPLYVKQKNCKNMKFKNYPSSVDYHNSYRKISERGTLKSSNI